MVIFHNTTTDISGPHPLSLHAGMPVEAGEKWAFNLWFRLHDTRESFDAAKALPSVVFGSSSSNPAINQAQVTQALDTAKERPSDTAGPQSASNSVNKAQDDQPLASQPQASQPQTQQPLVSQAQVAQSQMRRLQATPAAGRYLKCATRGTREPLRSGESCRCPLAARRQNAQSKRQSLPPQCTSAIGIVLVTNRSRARQKVGLARHFRQSVEVFSIRYRI